MSNLDFDKLEENLVELNVPILSGIYFLYYRNKIVYIGKSINVYSRIRQHEEDNSKLFDNVKVIFTESIDKEEIYFIKKYNPFYNGTHNDNQLDGFTYINDLINKEIYFKINNHRIIAKVENNQITCYKRGKIGTYKEGKGYIKIGEQYCIFQKGKITILEDFGKYNDIIKTHKKEILKINGVRIHKEYKNGYLLNKFLENKKLIFEEDLQLIGGLLDYKESWINFTKQDLEKRNIKIKNLNELLELELNKK